MICKARPYLYTEDNDGSTAHSSGYLDNLPAPVKQEIQVWLPAIVNVCSEDCVRKMMVRKQTGQSENFNV